MTMVWNRGQNNPIICRDASSDAGRDEPTPTQERRQTSTTTRRFSHSWAKRRTAK
ncbi:MAG: hypothetical protein IIC28_09705 [Chloroflexi bacterium]|nr:hypothetical protein [Chloroflexota bacterium]MCH8114803.1 hypothetical protein [Chloroflexota bacterium]MCI0834343.1 hypothetical protein [Chloroflexota bacterium]MCI0873572.1 hypothetical protein [Chloroflexota bacterium]MCI0881124.1 hypothetical protein [Chloroflexota bacterium]